MLLLFSHGDVLPTTILPDVLQVIVDRIADRTTTALAWSASVKVKRALSENLDDVQQLVTATLAVLPPVS